MNEDGNVNASSVGNQIRRIVIHNNLEAHMSRIDPDAAQAAEFSEYPEIPHAYEWAYILIQMSYAWARDLKVRKNACLR